MGTGLHPGLHEVIEIKIGAALKRIRAVRHTAAFGYFAWRFARWLLAGRVIFLRLVECDGTDGTDGTDG